MTYLDERRCGEAAAQRARERLGLGQEAAVDDVVHVVEDLAGLPVTILELPAGIAGLYVRKQGRGFVFVNGGQAAKRQRFTVAHELGHAELGHGGLIDHERDLFGAGRRPPNEIQANGFAAEFLVPMAGVRGWLTRLDEPAVSLETVVSLAGHYHVSAEVALYRLQNALRLSNADVEPMKTAIAADEHAQLRRRLGLVDPDDTIARVAREPAAPPRLPRATMTHAVNAYERGLLNTEQIADLLGIDRRRVEGELGERGAVAPADEPDY